MILDLKELKLFNKKFAEFVKVKPPHKIHTSMPDEACFIYLRNGHLKIQTASEEYSGTTKDTFLLKCGNYIGDFTAGDEKDYEAIVLHFYPEILQRIFKDINPEIVSGKSVAKETAVNNDEILEKYMDSLLFYFNNPSLADDELLILKIKEFILILSKLRDNVLIQQLYSYLFDPTELSFKDVVEKYIYSEVTLKDLAHLTNRSLSTFKRDFQKYYTTSPSKYLKDRKLVRAAELLRNSKISLSDLILECGFTNASHFTKIFKEKYNQTPSQYRLSQKEQ